MQNSLTIAATMLVASAVATFPPTDLNTCANLAGAAQTTCFQQVADAQAAADLKRLSDAANKETAADAARTIKFVQANAAGLQAGLNAHNPGPATQAWCEGEFIAEFIKLVGADQCKKLCAQFAQANVVDTSSSQKAFECLIPLTTKAVDAAPNDSERAAAVATKEKATLLFVSTQFQDPKNGVLVTNGKGNDPNLKFSDATNDIAFNANEKIDLAVGQEQANDLNKARAVDAAAAAAADPLQKAFVSFFIPKLEIQADVAAARADLRADQPVGAVTDTVFKAAEQKAANAAQPATVVFTNLGLAAEANDAVFAKQLADFVSVETGVVVANNNKRAPVNTQVGAFGQDNKEILANKLALVSFCAAKGLTCSSSKIGGVSKEEFVEVQVETKDEAAKRIAAEEAKKTTVYKETTVYKPTKAPTKAAGYGEPETQAHHAAPTRDESTASAAALAVGAVLAAVALFF